MLKRHHKYNFYYRGSFMLVILVDLVLEVRR